MTIAVAARARFDQVPPDQHCTRSPVSLTQLPFNGTDLRGRLTACSISGSADDVLHLLSDFEEHVLTAQVHGQSVPRDVVLHVSRRRPALYLILYVDAHHLLECQALSAQQLVRLGVAQATDYLHLFQRNLSCRARSRVQFQGVASPSPPGLHHLGSCHSVEVQRGVAVLLCPVVPHTVSTSIGLARLSLLTEPAPG